MSEQKRSTPQRSDAPTQRRRSNASPRRRSSRRGGMPQWLSGWIEHMALFFSTLGARIRRIGPRARTVMRESRARNFPESNRFLVQVDLISDTPAALPATKNTKTSFCEADPRLKNLLSWIASYVPAPAKDVDSMELRYVKELTAKRENDPTALRVSREEPVFQNRAEGQG